MGNWGAKYLQVGGPVAIVAETDALTDLNPSNDRLKNAFFSGTVTAGAFVTAGGTPGPATFSQITITQGVIVAQAAGLQQTVTWNNAAVTFTAQTLTITDTASNAASMARSVTVGAATIESLTKGGTLSLSGSLFAGSTVQAAPNAAFVVQNRSQVKSSADGQFNLLNNAATGFTRLTLGLETNAFPSWRAVGSHFRAELADGSAYTDVSLGNARLQNAVGAGAAGQIWLGATTQVTVGAAGGAAALPATPSGYWRIAVAGVQMVVPYYAQA